MDAISTLKQIIDKRNEFNLPTYILFSDYKKAYDRADRGNLFTILEARNVDRDFISLIKAFLRDLQLNYPNNN